MSDAPRTLYPRFVARRYNGLYWLDRLAGSRCGTDQSQAAGPWRDGRKAKRLAQQYNRSNRRLEKVVRDA
jgi:hypothetical protein